MDAAHYLLDNPQNRHRAIKILFTTAEEIGRRALGIGREAVLHRFRGFFPVMWLGAGLAVASGILLLCAYPAKALTNPVFAIKIACLAGAAWLVGVLSRGPSANRAVAAVALLLWLAGVAAGKLLLHTYDVLLVGR